MEIPLTRIGQALVAAVDAPRIAKPYGANSGITMEWLDAPVKLQKPSAFSQASKTTPGQLALFKNKFTDLTTVSTVVPEGLAAATESENGDSDWVLSI